MLPLELHKAHTHTLQVGNGNVAIDFEAVDAVYHSFTDNAAMAATLLSAAAGLVAYLATDAIEDPSGSTAVTAALVLLENPLLEEPDHHWYTHLTHGNSVLPASISLV